MTGCEDNYFQNGDLDFDGSPYWPEWPTGAQPTATFPGSFVQQLPTIGLGAVLAVLHPDRRRAQRVDLHG